MLCKAGYALVCASDVAGGRGTMIFVLFVCKEGTIPSDFVCEEFTDSCRYCNICFSAGYVCGK